MPLSTEDYKTLADHGMNGVICFQETYNHEHYKLYHPRGMKSKFEWRCDGFDRMGMAGVHSIGMGVLIGLGEGVAHGCSDDGSSPALPSEALLEDQVQRELPSYAPCTERRFPAKLLHDR